MIDREPGFKYGVSLNENKLMLLYRKAASVKTDLVWESNSDVVKITRHHFFSNQDQYHVCQHQDQDLSVKKKTTHEIEQRP